VLDQPREYERKKGGESRSSGQKRQYEVLDQPKDWERLDSSGQKHQHEVLDQPKEHERK